MSVVDSNLNLCCKICLKTGFISRNKLFKHIEICQALDNDKNSINVSNNVSLEDDINNILCLFEDIFIFAVGGRLRGRTLQSVEKYSLKRNEWQLVSPMNENRGSHGAASINSFVYAIGGGGLKSNLSTCEKYNFHNNQWEYIKSMHSFRHALAVVSYNNRFIYAIGGWFDGSKCSADVELYDNETNDWKFCCPMKIPRRLLGAAILDDKIYTFGGVSNDGEWFTNVVEVYDVLSDSWIEGPDLPIAEANIAVTVNNKIYIFIYGKSVFEFTPLKNLYIEKCKLPMESWFNFDATVVGDVVYLLGGNAKGVWLKSMYAYHVRSNEWHPMPDMIRQRRRCSSTAIFLEKSI